MRRSVVPTVLCFAALSFGTTGCGGPSDEERAEAAKVERVKREAAKKAAADRAEAAELKKAQAGAKQCEDTYGDLLEAEQEINSRLGVGMKPDTYFDSVSDLKVEYDKSIGAAAPDADMDAYACIQDVALPLEKAFNKFAEANNIWNDCVTDIDCDSDSITSRLQSRWSSASTQIEKSTQALKDLATTG